MAERMIHVENVWYSSLDQRMMLINEVSLIFLICNLDFQLYKKRLLMILYE